MSWIADNVTEVAIIGSWSASLQMVNVVHIQREEDDAAASARDVLNNWQDHIVPLLPNNYTTEGCRYTDHNVANGATGDLAPDEAKPVVGGVAGDALPPNNSVLVHKNISGFVGVRKGRMYLPPIAEAPVNEEGVIAGATVLALDTALSDFLDGLSGPGSNQLVVVHKVDAPGESTVSEVTSLTTDELISTQRRRLKRNN